MNTNSANAPGASRAMEADLFNAIARLESTQRAARFVDGDAALTRATAKINTALDAVAAITPVTVEGYAAKLCALADDFEPLSDPARALLAEAKRITYPGDPVTMCMDLGDLAMAAQMLDSPEAKAEARAKMEAIHAALMAHPRATAMQRLRAFADMEGIDPHRSNGCEMPCSDMRAEARPTLSGWRHNNI